LDAACAHRVVPAVSIFAEERTIKGSYMGLAMPSRDLPRFIAMYRACLLRSTSFSRIA
jgi:Zn-dependent alcohol dehydrogenase